MTLFSKPSEVWVSLKYSYKGQSFQFNLPLTQGVKFLDGLRIDFSSSRIQGGYRLELELEPLGSVRIDTLEIAGSLSVLDDLKSVFVNGYQSRTGSRERSPGERISSLNWPGRLLGMQLPGDDRFYNYSEKKGRFHGYTYAYLRYPETLLFTGSLDEDAGYTVIGIDVRRQIFSIRKDVEGLELDSCRSMLNLVILEGKEDEVFHRYRTLREDKVCTGPRGVFLDTGRRNRGTLNEVKVRRFLAGQREAGIPLTAFIIEDGWQSHTGDWTVPASGFPSGMASLATEIRGSGYIPGIRFAPFVVCMESSVFRNKKEWLARDSRGRIRPAVRSNKESGVLFALDPTRKGVLEYLGEVLDRFREWGFALVRADYLYAASVYPPPGKSRGEVMALAMEFLVNRKGNLFLEASGVQLGSAFGRAEYCRIGADTIPAWEDVLRRNLHGRERASTLNALRSTVGRRQLNGLFFASSTDSFRLSDNGNSIDASMRYTQLMLQYLLSDLVCTADDIGSYSEKQLSLYRSLFPVGTPEIRQVVESRRTVTVNYRVEEREYTFIANLADRPRPVVLPEGQWFCGAAPDRPGHHFTGGSRQVFKPGESRNYLLVHGSSPFAGSNGHLLPGCEIASLEGGKDGWSVEPLAGVSRSFQVWILDDGLTPRRINGRDADLVQSSRGVKMLTSIVTVPSASLL